MNQSYITYDEFIERFEKGCYYNGYVVGWGYASLACDAGMFYQSLNVEDVCVEKSYEELCDEISKCITKNEKIQGKDVVVVNLGDGAYYVGDNTTKVRCKITSEEILQIEVVCKGDSEYFSVKLSQFEDSFLNDNNTRPKMNMVKIASWLGLGLSIVSPVLSFSGSVYTITVQTKLSNIFDDVIISEEKFYKAPEVSASYGAKGKSAKYFAKKYNYGVQNSQFLYGNTDKQRIINKRNNLKDMELAPYQKTLRNFHRAGTGLNLLALGASSYGVYNSFTDPNATVADCVRSCADLGVAVIVFFCPGLWWVGALWFLGTMTYDAYQSKKENMPEEVFNKWFEEYYKDYERQYREGGPRKNVLLKTPVTIYDGSMNKYGPNGIPVSVRDATRTTVTYERLSTYDEPDLRSRDPVTGEVEAKIPKEYLKWRMRNVCIPKEVTTVQAPPPWKIRK